MGMVGDCTGERTMGSGFDSLGSVRSLCGPPSLLWRSEGGLSGAAAGCFMADIVLWDDA